MQTNINVLLVEDNLIAQTVAEMILTGLGCKVQVAVDGEQALEMFKANKKAYDFIFMDLGLPGISGLDVTKEIRKLEMHLLGVPIVALTANYDSSSTAICFAAGMNDFILKPLSKEKASAILTKFLS
jgi:two-component system aerobic respiration control sensor histidine kinase ArcB